MEKNISHLQVFGDPDLVIDRMNKNIEMRKVYFLKLLVENFTYISFSHIFRELKLADRFSKRALELEAEAITD